MIAKNQLVNQMRVNLIQTFELKNGVESKIYLVEFPENENKRTVIFSEDIKENKNAYSRALCFAFDKSRELGIRIRCDL